MKNNVTVIATKGVKVPLEHKANSYITDNVPTEVIMSMYYRRRIADGDLTIVKPSKTTTPKGGK